MALNYTPKIVKITILCYVYFTIIKKRERNIHSFSSQTCVESHHIKNTVLGQEL